MTSIILANDNRLRGLKLSLESIRKHAGVPYEFVVVDYGSRDGSWRYCIRRPEIKLISLPDRRRSTEGLKLGFKVALGEAYLLMNSGMRMTPGALKSMLRCLYSSEDIGIVVPVLTDRWSEEEENEPEAKKEPAGRRWQETERIGGPCFLFRHELGHRFGPFDEFAERVKQAGYRIMTAGDAFVYWAEQRRLEEPEPPETADPQPVP